MPVLRLICFFDFEIISKLHEKGSVIAEHHALDYTFIARQSNVIERRSYMGIDAVNHFITSLSEAWRRIKHTNVTYPLHIDTTQRILGLW